MSHHCIDKFIITVGTDKFVTGSYATVRNGWFFHQSFDRMPEKQIRVLRIQNNNFKLLFPIHPRVAKVYIIFIEFQLIHH